MKASSPVRLPLRLARFYVENRLWSNYLPTRPLVSYVGAPHSINLGDQLLYKAMQRLWEPVKLVPNSPLSKFQHSACTGALTALGQLLFKGMRSVAATMLGGGTLINDKLFFELFHRHHRQGQPFFLFGCGVRDPQFEGDRLAEECAFYKDALFIGVRDEHAQKCLAEHGVESTVIGDVVLAVGEPSEPRAGGRTVGINVGCDRVQYFGDQEGVNDAAAALIRGLVKDGWRVELFAMHDSDAREIASMRHKHGLGDVPFWRDYHRPDAFLKKVQEFDYVIGQRLHAVVTPCSFGIPSISMSYRSKCASFMHSMNMSKYVVRTDEVNEGRVRALFDDLVMDRERVNAALNQMAGNYRQMQKSHVQRICRTLKLRGGA